MVVGLAFGWYSMIGRLGFTILCKEQYMAVDFYKILKLSEKGHLMIERRIMFYSLLLLLTRAYSFHKTEILVFEVLLLEKA